MTQRGCKPGQRPSWIPTEQASAYQHEQLARTPAWDNSLNEGVLVVLLKRIKKLEARVSALEGAARGE